MVRDFVLVTSLPSPSIIWILWLFVMDELQGGGGIQITAEVGFDIYQRFWKHTFYLFFTILHPTFNVSQVHFSFVLVFAHRRVKVRSAKTTQQNKCLQIFSVDIYSWQIINNHYRAPAASPPCCPQPRKRNSSQTPAESGSQKASTSMALPSMWVDNTGNIFVII